MNATERAMQASGQVLQAPGALLRLTGDFVNSFHPRRLPPMLRVNYARELLSWFFLPVMLAAVEGGTISVIAKKAFAASDSVTPDHLDWAVAVLVAAPNVANLTSFLWAALAHGRAKVPFISALQVATALCVAAMAVVPETPMGLAALCALVFLGRCAWTGVLTLRAAVWRTNYPRASRATIAGKMASVQSIMLGAAGLLLGAALDLDARLYHFLFPLLAVAGLVGNAIYRKVRLRGQRRLARAELAGTAEESPSINPIRVLTVLREDHNFRWFMVWMNVLGFGSLMIGAPQAIVLTDHFHVSYLEGILNTTIIPVFIMPLAIPFWAKRLERMHVVRFRALHSWTFASASGIMWLGVWADSLVLFQVSAIVMGVAFAGGALAWNLGHSDFAPPHRDSEYMGVHVTLNGIRGLLAPLATVWLYNSIGEASGALWVFGAAVAVNVAGALGFLHMWQWLKKTPAGHPHRRAAETEEKPFGG